MRLQRNTGLATCGTSCMSAFPIAAVQGFATTDAGTWGDDDVVEEGSGGRSTAQKIIEDIKDIADKAAAAFDEAGEKFKVRWAVVGVCNARLCVRWALALVCVGPKGGRTHQ